MRQTGDKSISEKRGKVDWCSRNSTNAVSGSVVSAASAGCEIAAVALRVVAENAIQMHYIITVLKRLRRT